VNDGIMMILHTPLLLYYHIRCSTILSGGSDFEFSKGHLSSQRPIWESERERKLVWASRVGSSNFVASVKDVVHEVEGSHRGQQFSLRASELKGAPKRPP